MVPLPVPGIAEYLQFSALPLERNPRLYEVTSGIQLTAASVSKL